MLRAMQVGRKRGFTALLCLMLIFSSFLPPSHHTPKIVETITDHLEMIADHGHSHGFLEDLFWAIHGHSHDVADHDHSQIFLVLESKPDRPVVMRDDWKLFATDVRETSRFSIDRPPRA